MTVMDAGMAVGFAKVSIKGEGDWLVVLDLFARHSSGLRVKSAMTVAMLLHRFHPLIPCQALGQAL